jgi:hypothetical protein
VPHCCAASPPASLLSKGKWYIRNETNNPKLFKLMTIELFCFVLKVFINCKRKSINRNY